MECLHSDGLGCDIVAGAAKAGFAEEFGTGLPNNGCLGCVIKAPWFSLQMLSGEPGSNTEGRGFAAGISINGALKVKIGGSQTPSEMGFGVQMENCWVT